MMKHRGRVHLSFLVAVFFAVIRTSNGTSSAVPLPAASPLSGDAFAGKQTFRQYCSICHGSGAQGFIGPYIAGINWTVPGLHAIVRGGVGGYGGMPAFNADAVTDRNIADIAAYLASLPPATSPKLAATSQTTAVVAAPDASPSSAAQIATSGGGDPAHGRQVYTANCAACHGASAQGGVGPALHGERARKNTTAAIAWIKNPLPPMPKLYPAVLSEQDVRDVAAYVESL